MSLSIPILNQNEINKMRQAGEITAQLKYEFLKKIEPGITTKSLDDFAEDFIIKKGAKPAFKGHRDYPATLNTSINEEVVHGIPSGRKLREGDVLTVDVGVIWQGIYADSAFTLVIGDNKEHQVFLNLGKKTLQKAISECVEGNFVGDISATIQNGVEKAGYNVVRMFTGHGIGSELHQPPEIPCFGEHGTGAELKAGMGLAVEVMYMKGSSDLKILDDGWTAVTADGSLAAQFEETVIVGQEKPEVLTATKP